MAIVIRSATRTASISTRDSTLGANADISRTVQRRRGKTDPEVDMDASIVPPLSECHFYHAMDLPGIGPVDGDWDLRGRFDQYVGNVDLQGKTVLDVGTASGFLSFEAEKRGATVFSFDADGPERIQLVPPASRDPEHRAYLSQYFSQMRNSYKLAHHAFQSQATPVYGDVYGLSDVAPQCDIAIVAQILVHLRDPIGALEQAALLAKERLIIVEGVFSDDQTLPVIHFLGEHAPYAWWHLSLPLYKAVLPKLGFEIERVETDQYKSLGADRHTLMTLVSRRA
jgi:hypothetical protein